MTSKDIKITQVDDNTISVSAKIECDIGTFEIIIEKVQFNDIDINKGKLNLSGNILTKNDEDSNESKSIIVNVID